MGWVTFALHALVDDSIQQRPTVVAKRWTAVGVDLEAVFGPRVLQHTPHTPLTQHSHQLLQTVTPAYNGILQMIQVWSTPHCQYLF